MKFAENRVEIHHVSKVNEETKGILSLGLFLVTEEFTDVWETRETYSWEGGLVTVVSKAGLIKLKGLRNSGLDQDDIQKLKQRIQDEKRNVT